MLQNVSGMYAHHDQKPNQTEVYLNEVLHLVMLIQIM